MEGLLAIVSTPWFGCGQFGITLNLRLVQMVRRVLRVVKRATGSNGGSNPSPCAGHDICQAADEPESLSVRELFCGKSSEHIS